jgi:endonuclease YncB( thermonuclease family)
VVDFKVGTVIDGDTFTVVGGWVWGDEKGDTIRPAGYDAPELGTPEGVKAANKLNDLIGDQIIQVGDVHTLSHGRLVCEVFYDGKNLADYFPEYK